MTIKEVKDSFLRLVGVDSDAGVAVQTGYRNTDGERTQLGIHLLLNFIEENNKEEFFAWLRSKRDVALEESKNKKSE